MTKCISRSGLIVICVSLIVHCIVYYIMYIRSRYATVSVYAKTLALSDVANAIHQTNNPSVEYTMDVIENATVSKSMDYEIPKIQADNAINNASKQFKLKTGGSGNDQSDNMSKNHRSSEMVGNIDRVYTNNARNSTVPLTNSHAYSKTRYRIVWFKLIGGYYGPVSRVNMSQCEYSDCSVAPIDVTRDDDMTVPVLADAVIFQGNQLLPDYPPKRLSPRQVYIFFDMECPQYIHRRMYKSTPWKGVFNWTLTYRRDSDIFNPYKLPIMKTVDDTTQRSNYTSVFKKKTKTAFWLVSHCGATSKREQYVKLLSQYIDVDTFGKCGIKYTCTRGNDSQCLPELAKQYKFYLAFENSLCQDYVTEKYYKTLALDTVAVVRGGADYKSLVRDGTYINTADFKSVKDLADHLKEIGSSEEKYTVFLKAKRDYGDIKFAYQRSLCEVCRRLHNVDKYQKSYPDIGYWWTNDTCKMASDLV